MQLSPFCCTHYFRFPLYPLRCSCPLSIDPKVVGWLIAFACGSLIIPNLSSLEELIGIRGCPSKTAVLWCARLTYRMPLRTTVPSSLCSLRTCELFFVGQITKFCMYEISRLDIAEARKTQRAQMTLNAYERQDIAFSATSAPPRCLTKKRRARLALAEEELTTRTVRIFPSLAAT